MKRLDVLERKIKTANDLQSIVKTMKGLAAVSINQYEHAVDSIIEYYTTVEMGLQIILRNEPGAHFMLHDQHQKKEKKLIAVIFGSGQPMCGAFNEVLANFFIENWIGHKAESSFKIIATGHRISANLERLECKADHQIEMPSTLEHINDTVQSLVLSIQQWYSEEGYSEAYLFYNRPEANDRYKPVMQQLIPINSAWLQQLSQKKWESRSIPMFTLDASVLLSELVKQLLFVSLYRAFAESLSAENNSRLAAMQAAEKKISEMIENLTKSFRNQRQVNITEEILDIVSSFEVLNKET